VIIIIVTVTAATIPTILPALANRRVREASRMVNVFFAGARNRALQTGRPVGVMLERFNGLSDAAMTLSYCEVPPPYAGDFSNSRVVINNGEITSFATNDLGWQGMIREFDLIKFNYQGHVYQIDVVTPKAGFVDSDLANNHWKLVPVTGPLNFVPPNSPATGVPFQIFRAPVKLSSGSIQLPEGIVIDLSASGFDTPDNTLTAPVSAWGFQSAPAALISPATQDTSPVMITFMPSGSVDKVWCWDNLPVNNNPKPVWRGQEPVTPIHLLIGRRELLPLTPTPKNDPNKADYNWQDPTNLWVSINVQTGLVATAENAVPKNTGDTVYQQLLDVRQFARESHTMGGR